MSGSPRIRAANSRGDVLRSKRWIDCANALPLTFALVPLRDSVSVSTHSSRAGAYISRTSQEDSIAVCLVRQDLSTAKRRTNGGHAEDRGSSATPPRPGSEIASVRQQSARRSRRRPRMKGSATRVSVADAANAASAGSMARDRGRPAGASRGGGIPWCSWSGRDESVGTGWAPGCAQHVSSARSVSASWRRRSA